jgi:hypothetical protein
MFEGNEHKFVNFAFGATALLVAYYFLHKDTSKILSEEEQLEEANDRFCSRYEWYSLLQIDEFQVHGRLKKRINAKVADLLGVKSDLELVANDWPVVPGHCKHGVGDLVFQDVDGNFYVIETKWINYWSEKEIVEKKMRKVKEQARRYGSAWAAGNPGKIVHHFAIINCFNSSKPKVLERCLCE